MKTIIMGLSAIAGTLFLSGCYGGYYHPYGYYDAYGNRYVYAAPYRPYGYYYRYYSPYAYNGYWRRYRYYVAPG